MISLNKNILKSPYSIVFMLSLLTAIFLAAILNSQVANAQTCYGESYPTDTIPISCDDSASGERATGKCYQLVDDQGRRWVEIPCPGSPTTGGIEGPTLEELQPIETTKQNIDAVQSVKDNPIYELFLDFINFFSAGVGLVLTTMIVVGGIQYMSSNGNPQKTQEAISRISNALIGLVIYIFMFAILQWLIPGGLFG